MHHLTGSVIELEVEAASPNEARRIGRAAGLLGIIVEQAGAREQRPGIDRPSSVSLDPRFTQSDDADPAPRTGIGDSAAGA